MDINQNGKQKRTYAKPPVNARISKSNFDLDNLRDVSQDDHSATILLMQYCCEAIVEKGQQVEFWLFSLAGQRQPADLHGGRLL